jgi:hypothetical protein
LKLMLAGALALLGYIVVHLDLREWKREREREKEEIKRVYGDNSTKLKNFALRRMPPSG